jgi:hypothetical protein
MSSFPLGAQFAADRRKAPERFHIERIETRAIGKAAGVDSAADSIHLGA